MAFACSTALNHAQIHGHHGFLSRDVQALFPVREQQIQFGFRALGPPITKGIKPKRRQRVMPRATVGEDIEDKSTGLSEKEDAPEKGTQASSPDSPSVSSPSPFVGAKISSRIAARSAGTTNSRNTAWTTTPITSPSSKTPSSQGISTPSSPLSGAEKLKGAKPSVFLNSKEGFKELGPKNLLNALRQSDLDSGRTTKFGQPVVPTNLFDEPKKLTPEEKKFEFTLNAGQLVLISSFLTIISIMLGTAFLVWKVGAIHYNEY